jgi:hypothetical protein
MRLLICGGREYKDTEKMYEFLDTIAKEVQIDCIIEGDARGADRMAGFWARKNKIDNVKFPAKWDEHGRAAGIIRNKQMLEEGKPDLVIAFPGGNGTANMIFIAKQAGVEVVEVG